MQEQVLVSRGDVLSGFKMSSVFTALKSKGVSMDPARRRSLFQGVPCILLTGDKLESAAQNLASIGLHAEVCDAEEAKHFMSLEAVFAGLWEAQSNSMPAMTPESPVTEAPEIDEQLEDGLSLASNDLGEADAGVESAEPVEAEEALEEFNFSFGLEEADAGALDIKDDKQPVEVGDLGHLSLDEQK